LLELRAYFEAIRPVKMLLDHKFFPPVEKGKARQALSFRLSPGAQQALRETGSVLPLTVV